MSSSAKLPASDKTENDDASLPADVIMSMSAVDHSTDPISQEAMERLEMRRLGLPLSFGARRKKKKPKTQTSRTGNKNAPTYRKVAAAANSVVDSSSGKWQVEARAGEQQTTSSKNPLSTYTLPADDFELIDFEEATANEDKLELMAEVACSSSSSSGPDEVTTLKLTDDSFDFVELDKLDKLRISGGDDDDDNDNDESEDYKSEQQQQPNKRDRPENDSTTTTTSATSSEVSREEFTQSASHHSNHHHHHHHHSLKKKRSKRAMNNTYYKQRFLLFSRFAEGICLDRESWYSVTPEPIARHIAERIERALLGRAGAGGQQKEDITTMPSSSSGKKFIILDGFCGAGGNTIQFALMPSTALVLAVDIDPRKIELARHNAAIYGCLDKIQFIVADFFEVIQSVDQEQDQEQDGRRLPWWAGLVDACFLSPPWGGPDYLTYESYSLAQMTPDGFEIARRVADRITKNISFLLPRNFDLGEMPALSAIVYRRPLSTQEEEQGREKAVEIEENLLYKKVKTLTAYFGDLVIKKEGEDGGEEVATLLKTAQVCSPPPLLLADEDEEEEEE